jgi:hypothetical protein
MSMQRQPVESVSAGLDRRAGARDERPCAPAPVAPHHPEASDR